MNNFKIILQNIQHIDNFNYEFDLSLNKLHCIVGKNSVGKTTLVKSIQTFKEITILDKLSRNNIIKNNSKIIYEINGIKDEVLSEFRDSKYILNSNSIELNDYKDSIFTELPIPYGQRFKTYNNFTQEITEYIRSKFSIKQYGDKPKELIKILNFIYKGNKRFDNLEQLKYRKTNYYIIPKNEQYYLREDDFSSGEYMIVQIYKLIQNKTKMIVIDELDISLDSSAQIKFIRVLKYLCKKYKINIVFTTHSLAIMKKIDEINEELLYMEYNNGIVNLEARSYNFIKAELFQEIKIKQNI